MNNGGTGETNTFGGYRATRQSFIERDGSSGDDKNNVSPATGADGNYNSYIL